ncbi:MAG: cytochrome c biogenesis CcdA family protein [Bacillota bacterium]
MLEQFLSETIPQLIGSHSPLVFLFIFLGGIATSLSPCTLSLVPVVVGYIGGYGEPNGSKKPLAFVLGLAVTFGILGVLAASLGRIFGQIGQVWYLFMAAVAIVMGLNLLGIFRFNFPGLKFLPAKGKGFTGSFLVGIFFGLVASPCSTPVLAVIMAYVASRGELAYGGVLLFFYGLGHGVPLFLAGTFTATLKGLRFLQPYTRHITYLSGMVLIGLGMYLLSLVV